jgi:hypothetical protein
VWQVQVLDRGETGRQVRQVRLERLADGRQVDGVRQSALDRLVQLVQRRDRLAVSVRATTSARSSTLWNATSPT